MCWEPSFPPNSVFLPHRLLAHYTTCLPFEERFTYLLTMRAFRERGGWWGVETPSYAVLKVKWAKDLCFVHPSADLKPPAVEILVRFSLKFPPRTGRGDFITAAPTSPLHLLDLPFPHLHLCAKLFTAITFKAFLNSLHVVPSASLNIQPLICYPSHRASGVMELKIAAVA